MWVTKLLISPVNNRIFCPKTTNFGLKLAFLVNLARPCRLIQCPIGGSVGGCGARAVSRKTPIYFMDICIMYTCIMDTCTMDTCIMGTYIMDTCIMDTCIMDTCIMDTCIMDTSAWVTRPERPKGAKGEVKDAQKAAE